MNTKSQRNFSFIKSLNFFILIFFILLISVSIISAGIVTREISDGSVDEGDVVTVKLIVDVDEGETYYAIDEKVLEGWEVVEEGDLDNSSLGHLRMVLISNAEDMTYTYKIKAEEDGEFDFTGTYMFEGNSQEIEILGDKKINVGYIEDSNGSNYGNSGNNKDLNNTENNSLSLNSSLEDNNLIDLFNFSDKSKLLLNSKILISLTTLILIIILIIVIIFSFKKKSRNKSKKK